MKFLFWPYLYINSIKIVEYHSFSLWKKEHNTPCCWIYYTTFTAEWQWPHFSFPNHNTILLTLWHLFKNHLPFVIFMFPESKRNILILYQPPNVKWRQLLTQLHIYTHYCFERPLEILAQEYWLLWFHNS